MENNIFKVCNAGQNNNSEIVKITRKYSNKLSSNKMLYEEEAFRSENEIIISITMSLLSSFLYDIIKSILYELIQTIKKRNMKDKITIKINEIKYDLINDIEIIIKILNDHVKK
ncbi:hypothetical protein [uncultured Bacteroides sp.]|uniref:hypothetical protein n=1 Tax=uncultured Bacteroides sp. TaxID=162156 RepID=UPI002AAAC485|nr:hypothetical protein [uncultured Bacteroides sp.]